MVGKLRRAAPWTIISVLLVGLWVTPSQAATLRITKTADQTKAWAGDAIGFTVTVTNPGSSSVKNLTLTDSLPADAGTSWSIDSQSGSACSIASGTMRCGIGSLGGGRSYAVHVTSGTTTATPSSSPVSNTASVKSGTGASASASASIDVLPPRVPTHIVAGPGVPIYTESCGLDRCSTGWVTRYVGTVVAEDGSLINEGTVWFTPDWGAGCFDEELNAGAAFCVSDFSTQASSIWFTARYTGSDKYAPSSVSVSA